MQVVLSDEHQRLERHGISPFGELNHVAVRGRGTVVFETERQHSQFHAAGFEVIDLTQLPPHGSGLLDFDSVEHLCQTFDLRAKRKKAACPLYFFCLIRIVSSGISIWMVAPSSVMMTVGRSTRSFVVWWTPTSPGGVFSFQR